MRDPRGGAQEGLGRPIGPVASRYHRTVPSPPPLPPDAHLRLLLEQVERRSDRQREEWDGLDRKATTILAASGVLLALVINNQTEFGRRADPGPVLFTIAVGALVIGICAAVVVMFPRTFVVVPEPQALRVYASGDESTTMATLVATQVEAFRLNRESLQLKLKGLRIQMALTAVAVVALALGLTAEVKA